MPQLILDLRDAWRHWTRTPLASLVALASLTLGLGITLALAALVDTVLLRPLPVRNPDTLVRVIVDEPDRSAGPFDAVVTLPVWEHLQRAQPFASRVAAFATDRFNLAPGGEVRYVAGLYVSGDALDMLGISPVRGRSLTTVDDVGGSPVVMISPSLWAQEFAGAADPVGRTIRLDGQPFTVVGVTPSAFYGLEVGRRADVILPVGARRLIAGPAWAAQRDTLPWLTVYGRLGPGASPREASARLAAWTPALRAATLPPGPAADRHLTTPLSLASGARGLSWLRRQYERPMLVLLAAAGLVLAIACVNLSAMILARFADRHHELGVRLALGATRRRLVRALLTETLLLAAAGTALALVLARWLVSAVVPYLTSPALRGLAPVVEVAVDKRLAAVAALLAVATAVAAGLAPAWRVAGAAPQTALSTAARPALPDRRATRSLRVIVVLQVALAMVLGSAAALLVRSFAGLATAPTGLEPDRVLVAALGGELAGPPGRRFERLNEIVARLAAIPGVEAVSAGVVTPLNSMMAAGRLEVPGSQATASAGSAGAMSPFNRVLPGYFQTLGIPVVRGREFDDRDDAGTPPVAVVNEAFAAEHYGDTDPLGRIIRLGALDLTIVGIVANHRHMSRREPRPMPMAFGLLTQLSAAGPLTTLRFLVRGAAPEALRAPVAAAMRSIDPRIGVEFRTVRDEADATINRERLLAWLSTGFSGLGLLITLVGVYGTVAYVVIRRRLEFGVRMALGAARGDILRLVLGDAVGVIGAGLVTGVVATLAAGRLMASLLVGVSPRDPWMLGLALIFVGGAGLAASAWPAHRAAGDDPAAALRTW